MLRVVVYLKSGAVAEFDAAAIEESRESRESRESQESHPRFRLEFRAAEGGGRRLVYLDRDDVSAVVVEERGDEGGGASRGAAAGESAPVAVPEAIRQEVQEVLAIATTGAAGKAEPTAPAPRRRRR